QYVIQGTLGLEGEHATRAAHRVGEIHRERTEMRAHVEHDHARRHDLPEQLDLEFGIFAVEIERAADIRIAGVIDHRAALAHFDPHGQALENNLVGHR